MLYTRIERTFATLVEWPYEYTTSGENCFRCHSPKMRDIVPNIAEHVRMGSVFNDLCWLLIDASIWGLTECVFVCFGGCAATLGGDNKHSFANFWITACRRTPKFWRGHHGTCAHHSNCPPPPSGVGSDSDHFTPAQPAPRVEPKFFSTWHNHHWSKLDQVFFQVL